MQLHIIAVGRKKSEYDDMIREYEKRIVAPFSIAIEILSESEKIISKIKESDYVVALDEQGKDFTTTAFAEFIEKKLQGSHKRMVFIIGGAYGLDDAIRDRADLVLRLGSFTLPHELARLVLVEQLYRVTNVIKGGKYHHQ